jgi:hypothetical protein
MRLILNIFILAISCVDSLPSHAQISTNVNVLTQQEKQYLSTVKSVYQDYRKVYKQYRKDSLRLERKLRKEAKENGTRLLRNKKQFLQDSLERHYNLDQYAPYASSYHLYKQDKKKFKQEVLRRGQQLATDKAGDYIDHEQLKALQQEYSPYISQLNQYTTYLKNPDSLGVVMNEQVKNMESMLERRLLDFEEVAAFKQQQEQMNLHLL